MIARPPESRGASRPTVPVWKVGKVGRRKRANRDDEPGPRHGVGMTDRARHVPTGMSNAGPNDPRTDGAPTAPNHLDSAPRDDTPAMTLTLTHRPHGRTSTDTPTPPPTDRGRAWLTRLFAGDFAFPAVQPADLAPAARPPAEFDAAARAVGCRDLFV